MSAAVLSEHAVCVCDHRLDQHARHVDGALMCIALVPARSFRRAAAQTGEGVLAHRNGGLEHTNGVYLSSRMVLCSCTEFSMALCPHGEEAWQGCPACRDDEYDTRLGERER